jgi:hypothetical protein
MIVLVKINQLSYGSRYSIFSLSPVNYKRLVRDPEAVIDAVLEDIEGQKIYGHMASRRMITLLLRMDTT